MHEKINYALFKLASVWFTTISILGLKGVKRYSKRETIFFHLLLSTGEGHKCNLILT